MSEEAVRHDPFDDEALKNELASFSKPSRPVSKPDQEVVKKVAEEGGFLDRTPKPTKLPLKPIQFRLHEEEIEEFHQMAYEVFGNKHGAKTDLFRRMIEHYKSSGRHEQKQSAWIAQFMKRAGYCSKGLKR